MIDIPVDKVLELPVKDIIAGECVAYGILDDGILIHYLERDIVRLITWEDIVGFGIGLGNEMILPERPEEQVREITKPEGLPHG
jgi:hypothetical protein